ncbi:prepilin peptidase [SCandidatus Aminicenantes bacterium Aminicenantia_JdfR_composite]|jgi:leader peptidase (prepilin peptidase)/N-methyltransferase|nr:prepilin peptidase [SCandidatus Aminicenantes bacterium Aminicenantia_JdfR_composite]MCP2596289.1 prepilin peptidase [Candidatus Aminicenantes bacterium AC-335-G13]MCP2597864.1 prepilin peptidase [Candidatus Aminicenantes bacterium AC-335-L06]MCP2620479.1 prepilin peptidase [Candidatus Aminicenantes bacterium AC-334-E05]
MVLIIIILFGLIWGSFLNVIIYRLPRNISIVKPASFCPSCKHKIPFYYNIPLISFIILKGKCKYCGNKISFMYPLVELLTPISIILLYFKYSFTTFFLFSFIFTSALIVLAFIDYYHQILPNEITIPGSLLFLGYSFLNPYIDFTNSLLGMAFGGGILFLIYWIYLRIKKIEGLGLGDVKMMIMVGSFLGWLKTLFTLLIGTFAAASVGIFLIIFKGKDLKYSLPFGTFLSPSAFIALMWGSEIIKTYLNLFKKN